LRQTLEAAIKRATDRRQRVLEACTHKLDALSPLKVLDRGFSLTQDAQGHLVTRADQVRPGDAITVRLRDGALAAEVSATGPGSKRGESE
jgi:exodeoxyribonuclease VII large subunit